MKSTIQNRQSQIGFTLIELLVVVTIIVILLALLVPALDKAIYQAEMAVCGAHLRGIASGVTTYAAGNGRRYPHRPTATAGYQRPGNIAHPPSIDDRPYIRDYFGLDMLLDPLSGGIDLDATHPSSTVFSNYLLWFGFAYTKPGGGQGMMRIGDRLTWDTNRYDILASDEDTILVNFPGVTASHPDVDGVLRHAVSQDESPQDFRGLTGNENVDGRHTMSRWFSNDNWRRGVFDTQFARSDNSVERFNDVKPNGDDATLDERFDKVPTGNGSSEPEPSVWWIQVPKR